MRIRHPLLASFVALNLLVACHIDTVGASHPVKAANPGNTASNAPVVSARAPAGPSFLLANSGSTKLAGSLALDARYLVASGGTVVTRNGTSIVLAGRGNAIAPAGGTVISNDGGTVISNDGGTLITNDGGSLITNDGGSLITNDGGGIIAQGGGNVVAASAAGKANVSDNGSSIIAQGGGNIIAQGGGNIIAQGGGNIIAQGGGNAVTRAASGVGAGGVGSYRLASVPAIPPGTMLPAAGMLVSVVDLASNQYLSLGKDKGGKNVYAIYTNAKGGYEVYLPKSASQHVLVVASQPGSSDGRLTYNLITAPGGQAPVLDEYSSLVTRYVRVSMSRRLKVFLKQNSFVRPTGCSVGSDDETTKAFKQLTGSFIERIGAAALAAHLAQASELQQDRVASLMDDYILEKLPALNTIETDTSTAAFKFDPGVTHESGVEFLAATLKDFTDRARDRLRQDPAAFDQNVARMVSAINDANAQKRLQSPCALTLPDLDPKAYRIEKPTDLAAFFVEGLLADGDDARAPYGCELFELLGMVSGGDTNPHPGPLDDLFLGTAWGTHLDVPNRPSIRLLHHIVACMGGFVTQLGLTLVDPAMQCKLINEVKPDACQVP
jgi:hypothetical protein